MSLLERSRAGAATLEDARVAKSDEAEAAEALAFLRQQVQGIISPEEIAKLARSNPMQAKNEVRNACRRAFSHVYWDRFGASSRAHFTDAILNSIFGFGPLEALLTDESVTEIMVNGRKVFFERDGVIYPAEQKFSDDAEVMAIIDRIIGPLGRRVDEASPMVNARLPQGYRVNAIIPPVAIDGPAITIRKFSARPLFLEDLERNGSFGVEVRQFLIWAVRLRKNIAVSGGTGSGKTTLLNALSCCIPAQERIVTIEDSAELRFMTHPNVVRLEARPINAEGKGEITIRDLVTNALRMRPDRIVVGECRGAEALDMLQAMNTGHDGSLTTLHANSPEEVMSRVTTMVRYGADLPVEVIEEYIASAFHLVVQTARLIDGKRKIVAIASFACHRAAHTTELITLYRNGRWERVPEWAADVVSQGIATKSDYDAWLKAVQ